MNKKLVFSWGHIIALLALITLSYFAFMGFCYYTGGHFAISGILVAGINALLIFTFIGAQQLKIWDGPFQKYIFVERWFLFVLAPIAIVAGMYPVNHWLGLHENEGLLVTRFTEAIDTTKMMFSDYEAYANERINQLDNHILERQRKATASRAKNKTRNENTNQRDEIERRLNRENSLRALRLQLTGQNYKDVHSSAMEWIENTAAKPSTYNVFILGNINQIDSAITGWNQQLHNFSILLLSDEPKQTTAYDANSPYIMRSTQILNQLKALYRERQPLNSSSPWVALGLFVLMMVPWWAQSRNTKNTYRLFGHEGAMPLDKLLGRTSKQKGKKSLKFDEHDYQRHVRKF